MSHLGFQKEWPNEAIWSNAQASRRARQTHPGAPCGGVGGEGRVWTFIYMFKFCFPTFALKYFCVGIRSVLRHISFRSTSQFCLQPSQCNVAVTERDGLRECQRASDLIFIYGMKKLDFPSKNSRSILWLWAGGQVWKLLGRVRKGPNRELKGGVGM